MRFLLLLTLLFPSLVWASKARLQSLGLSENGSLLIEDSRGVFLNPAQLAGEKNSVNLEMGSSTVPSTPNAEGGFVYDLERFKLAVQLGRETNMATDVDLMNSLSGSYDFLTPQNVIELILAGDSPEFRWGASVQYASSSDDATSGAFPNRSATNVSFRAGIANDRLEGYGYIDLIRSSESETAAGVEAEFDGGLGIGVGGRLNLTEKSLVYGSIDIDNTEASDGAGTTGTEVSAFILQAGYKGEVPIEAGRGFFFYAAGFFLQQGEFEDTVGNVSVDNNALLLPVVFGIEMPVKPWLDLRGSVSQNVILQNIDDGDEDSNFPNSTTVAAGVSMKFGQAQLDATLEGATSGEINSDTLLANAALIYQF